VELFALRDLRRTCITDLLAGGTDVLVVQLLACHSDPRTTMRYDRSGEVAKRTAALKLHVPFSPRKLGGNKDDGLHIPGWPCPDSGGQPSGRDPVGVRCPATHCHSEKTVAEKRRST
jgi:hypothetical protein